MKNVKVLSSLLAFTVMASVACSPNNPKKQPPPEKNDVVQIDPGTLEVAADSKVDILFVIDDSQSMKKHQDNVSQNIKNFVKEFEKNALIDFHIGVTSAFDSRIRGELARRGLTETRFSTRQIDVNPLGHLLPLKTSIEETEVNEKGESKKSEKVVSLPGNRFITKETPDYVKVLENTLLVGAKPGPDQLDATTIGPWFEELFSPIRAILSEPQLSTVNKGFYRPEATLVVFLLTDANDESTTETAESIRSFLLSLKGGDPRKVQAYAAIVPSGVKCARDGSGEPRKIEAFLDSFQNREKRVLNLCSANFGARLAQFGKDISEQLPEKVIEIPGIPEAGSIKVYYGQQLLKQPDHYVHVVRTNTSRDKIVLRRNLDVKFEKNAKIRVDFIPVRLENQSNGRTKPI